MRQPIGAIRRLRDLQFRAAVSSGFQFCDGNAVAPVVALFAQNTETIENAIAPHRTPAKKPRPHRRTVTAVAGEQFVTAFAAQYDLHVAPCRFRQHVGWNDGVIGGGIVHCRDNGRQFSPEIGCRHLNLDMLGAALRPPEPARVPLAFSLVSGSTSDAVVPARTQVAAASTESQSAPVIFETERELVVIAASLDKIFVRQARIDSFADLSVLCSKEDSDA